MNYHIKDIFLGEQFADYTVGDNKEKSLPNLSKINIFVGANNSGKSRFLRSISNTENLAFTPFFNNKENSGNLQEINTIWSSFVNNVSRLFSKAGIDALGIYPQQLTKFVFSPKVNEKKAIYSPMLTLLREVVAFQEDNGYPFKGNRPSHTFIPEFKQLAKEHLELITSKIASYSIPDSYEFKKLYFPILRGLRPSAKDTNYFEDRTKRDYFGNELHTEIFTGIRLYHQIQNLLLGDLHSRRTVAKFEKFLSELFFDGKPISLIPKLNSDVLDVKIGDEKEFPIHGLGDGIQSIIILTFPLFLYQDLKVLAFFEEPEIYMHPSLQRAFLNALNSQFPNHQYFLTTHSNHFLDITLDLKSVSVYTFSKVLDSSEKDEKEAGFKVENVSNEDQRSLEILGVRNSSVFLSNCTVWVEGITDRRYFQHYLKLLQDKLTKEQNGLRRMREDLHYSFVEYGGGNITHWSFLDNKSGNIVVERLCGKLFLITDKDNATTGAKHERHEKLEATLKERYYCLKCREVENLLSVNVLRAVIKDYEGEGMELAEFEEKDYQREPLGRFIESKLPNRKREGTYAAESGTITDKVKFCDKAISKLHKYEDLSEEAKTLTQNLYEFITAHHT